VLQAPRTSRSHEQATRFYVGERVFFAGDARRSGTNAEYIAVDERIMALAPTSIELPAAASLPLVSLTAWEGLFEGAGLKAGDVAGQTILVLPGAGGYVTACFLRQE
jgi:NADPH2:quinone reductase